MSHPDAKPDVGRYVRAAGKNQSQRFAFSEGSGEEEEKGDPNLEEKDLTRGGFLDAQGAEWGEYPIATGMHCGRAF